MNKILNGKTVKMSKRELEQFQLHQQAEELKHAEYIKTAKYRDDRIAEYPKLGDQLDALLKQFNYMRISGALDLVQEMDDTVNQWLAVKAKYPKPEEKV